MKLSKWMKWTLIIGAVFCLVGVGVMTCGTDRSSNLASVARLPHKALSAR